MDIAWNRGLGLAAPYVSLSAAPAGVTFDQSAPDAVCYQFVEVTLRVDKPDVSNPFTDVSVEGQFASPGAQAVSVDGFCDSADGSLFRIRFMPTKPGDYDYSVTYRQGTHEVAHKGKFTAAKAGSAGLLRVDRDHPLHFICEGTGEHFFWNCDHDLLAARAGDDEADPRHHLDRLAKLGVNRIRVAIERTSQATGVRGRSRMLSQATVSVPAGTLACRPAGEHRRPWL